MANSVTARFNDDCKVFVSMSDDTTVEKAVIIDADGNETDIGGGGGESDFSTATVTVAALEDGFTNELYHIASVDNEYNEIVIDTPYVFVDSYTWLIPLYKGKLSFYVNENIGISGDFVYDSESRIFTITGDCTIKGYKTK